LENVREAEETEMVHLDARWDKHFWSNLENKLFEVLENQTCLVLQDAGGVEPEPDGGVALRVEFGLLDDL